MRRTAGPEFRQVLSRGKGLGTVGQRNVNVISPVLNRSLSTGTRLKLKDPPRDPFVHAVKYFALCLLAIGCFKIYPYVGEFTLIHSVGLLDSRDPFFVRVGLSRMRKMIRTENGAKKVIEASAVTKCQMLLDSDTDQKLIPMILDVLELLSTFDASRPTLQQEGVLEWIDQGIRDGRIDAEKCENSGQTLEMPVQEYHEQRVSSFESSISEYKRCLDVVLLVDETTKHVTLQIGSGLNVSSHSSTTEGDEKRFPERSSVESVHFERIHGDERCDTEAETGGLRETTTSPIIQQEETQQPAFLEALSATLSPQKTNKELVDMTLQAYKQFEDDRAKHCQLIERLDVCLSTLRREKSRMLEMLVEMRFGGEKPSDQGMHFMAYQEQLLRRVVVGKQLLQRLQKHVPKKTDDGEMHFRDVNHHVVGNETRREEKKSIVFTKKPLPEWLSEDVPSASVRPRRAAVKSAKCLHPLWDMALKVEKKREGNAAGQLYHVQWVPKKSKVVSGGVPSEGDRSASPLKTRSFSPKEPPAGPHSAPLFSAQIPSELKGEKQQASTEREADAGNVLQEMTKMGFESTEQKDASSAQVTRQETSVPSTASQATATEKVKEPEPDAPEVPRTKGDGESPAVQMAVSSEAPKPSMFAPLSKPGHYPSLFQVPVQTPQMQASSIAGGAAFGQPSVPRANFGINSVAPQLGSLHPPNSNVTDGGSSGQGGFESFAAIGGGFAAFASQGSFQGVYGQPSGGGFNQQSGFSTSVAPSSGTEFAHAASTTSLFGMRPAQESSKMWEMRK